MFDLPQIMRTAQDMARHAAARQTVIAENIAHSDTPGYKAKDLPDFGNFFSASHPLRATRAGHIGADLRALEFKAETDAGSPSFSPNGNTVSLEREMIRSAETRQGHDLALAVYGSTRGILRSALGR